MKGIFKHIHHLFIPKESNNFRARILHHDFLTIYLVAALMLTAGVSHYQSKQGSILGYATDISVNKLYELTNAQRASSNLQSLSYSDALAQAAQKKAEDMFAKNYWAHYGPAGETPWNFILSSGYQYEFAGENLAKNFLFSDGVVDAWMNSPTHRENLLRPDYTDVGFAIVNGVLNGEETTLVVQMFGKPLYVAQDTAPQQTDTEVAVKEVETEATAPEVIQNPESMEQIAQAAPAQDTKVLASQNQTNFYPVFFNMNLIFFLVLAGALALDFYFASKLNLVQLKGKHVIHFMFIGFITVGLFILANGNIL
ncbi:MAG: CAP domain-containing protein [Weeksellaceae bacterium]